MKLSLVVEEGTDIDGIIDKERVFLVYRALNLKMLLKELLQISEANDNDV